MALSIVPSLIDMVFSDFFGEGEQEKDYRIPYATYNYDQEKDIVTLKIEMPGAKKENISVKASDTTLSVMTKKTDEKDETPQYKRDFRFNFKIRPNTIKATYENGILTLVIERDIPQKVEVQIN